MAERSESEYGKLLNDYNELVKQDDGLKTELDNLKANHEKTVDRLKETVDKLKESEATIKEYNDSITAKNKAEEERIKALSEEEKAAEDFIRDYNALVKTLRETNEEYASFYVEMTGYLQKETITSEERIELIKKYDRMTEIMEEYKKKLAEEKQAEESKEEAPEGEDKKGTSDKEGSAGKESSSDKEGSSDSDKKDASGQETSADVPASDYEIAKDTTVETAIDNETGFAVLGLYETQLKIREDELEAERKAEEARKKAEAKKKAAAKKKAQQQQSQGGNGGGDYSSGGGGYTYTYTPPDISGFADRVVSLVNEQRAANGLGALSTTAELNAAAAKRAEEIASVFSHTRPNGSSCFTVMGEYGITYMAAGENIAAGQQNPEAVMNAWMNSEGHRNNILGANFGHMGVGCVLVTDGGYGIYWVQLFTD